MTIKPSDEQIPGTMQTECWHGERQFQLNEISFAEEIVVDDNGSIQHVSRLRKQIWT